MHVAVEQADERLVNLSKREELLLWHRQVLRIVIVGETICGSPAQDNALMRFGRVRIQRGQDPFYTTLGRFRFFSYPVQK
jgi:hypothetical protein